MPNFARFAKPNLYATLAQYVVCSLLSRETRFRSQRRTNKIVRFSWKIDYLLIKVFR